MQGTQEIVVTKRAYGGRASRGGSKLETRGESDPCLPYSPNTSLVMFTIDTVGFYVP